MERIQNFTLLTDFYQLTMMGGYYRKGHHQHQAVFDLFFRKLPFDGGYCIAAGLESALDYALNLRFGPEEIEYLRAQKLFSPEFLEALASFRFTGHIDAVPEGTVVFPQEPLLRIQAPLWEAQFIETALLNQVNFQTLIATKAARLADASKGAKILEFGARRAQGSDGALSATRASYIGGAAATSNVLAGKLFGIPVKGTMAHSWIMSFEDELEAFQAYADCYPNDCMLLVDTYDTLQSGVPNAIRVAKSLEEKGHRFGGIRLDSGDLTLLSRAAREMLDQAGLEHALITASNDLDEYLIQDLLHQGAKIDLWGVGTNLSTAKDCPALGGVYKLAAIDHGQGFEPRLKVAENVEKLTDPGIKDIFRLQDRNGEWLGDLLALQSESLQAGTLLPTHHRTYAHVMRDFQPPWEAVPLLQPVVRNGKRVAEPESLESIRQRSLAQRQNLAPVYRRFRNPERYWLGLTPKLWELKQSLLTAHSNRME